MFNINTMQEAYTISALLPSHANKQSDLLRMLVHDDLLFEIFKQLVPKEKEILHAAKTLSFVCKRFYRVIRQKHIMAQWINKHRYDLTKVFPDPESLYFFVKTQGVHLHYLKYTFKDKGDAYALDFYLEGCPKVSELHLEKTTKLNVSIPFENFIDSFSYLTHLELFQGPHKLPESFTLCQSLREAHFSELKDLSSLTTLRSLKNLTKLSFSTPRQEEKPLFIDISEWPKLTHLRLWITHPDHQLGELERKMSDLVDLYISGSIRALPGSFGKLTSLTTLSLISTDITAFPSFLCKMDRLKELNFRASEVRRIPKNILGMRNLVKLDLSLSHQLEKIPKELALLPNLRAVNLTGTRVSRIPLEVMRRRIWIRSDFYAQ